MSKPALLREGRRSQGPHKVRLCTCVGVVACTCQGVACTCQGLACWGLGTVCVCREVRVSERVSTGRKKNGVASRKLQAKVSFRSSLYPFRDMVPYFESLGERMGILTPEHPRGMSLPCGTLGALSQVATG